MVLDLVVLTVFEKVAERAVSLDILWVASKAEMMVA